MGSRPSSQPYQVFPSPANHNSQHLETELRALEAYSARMEKVIQGYDRAIQLLS